jgi:protein-serine/threonine kinase
MSTAQAEPSASSSSSQQANTAKPADYVYFDRTTAGFSDEAVPRAKTAQLKLEHFYKEAVDAAIERNTRCALYTACCGPRRADWYHQAC